MSNSDKIICLEKLFNIFNILKRKKLGAEIELEDNHKRTFTNLFEEVCEYFIKVFKFNELYQL